MWVRTDGYSAHGFLCASVRLARLSRRERAGLFGHAGGGEVSSLFSLFSLRFPSDRNSILHLSGDSPIITTVYALKSIWLRIKMGPICLLNI